MSSIPGTSKEKNSFNFFEFANLGREKQLKQMEESNSSEIFELFSSVFAQESSPETNSIKNLVLRKVLILKGKKFIQKEQLQKITEICLKVYPSLQHEEEVGLKNALIYFLGDKINKNSVMDLIVFAREIKSSHLMEQCLSFITIKTNISLSCNDFGPIDVAIRALNSDAELDHLMQYLPKLKNTIGPENIRVLITPGSSLSLENLSLFLNNNRDCLYSLELSTKEVRDAELTELLNHCFNLQHLLIKSIHITSESLVQISHLTNLRTLNLSGCKQVTDIPPLTTLTELRSIDLSWCSKLTNLPELNTLTRLEILNLCWCRDLKTLPELNALVNLLTLNLSRCTSLTELPNISRLVNLVNLNLEWCKDLKTLPELITLTKLEVLLLNQCTGLLLLPDLSTLTRLHTLNLAFCRELIQFPELHRLTNLEVLNLNCCLRVCTIPDLGAPAKLKTLNLSNCPNLSLETKLKTISLFLEANFEIAKTLLSSLSIQDTRCIEGIFAELDLDYYLGHLYYFNPPNQDVRIHVLEKLIQIDQNTAFNYAKNIKIENNDQFDELVLNLQFTKECIKGCSGLHNGSLNISFILSYCSAIYDNNFNAFSRLLDNPIAGEQLEKIKQNRLLQEFFICHKEKIWENNKTQQLIKRLYTAHIKENCFFYPLTGTLFNENQGIRIHCALHHAYQQPEDALTLITNLIEADIIEELPYDLDIDYYNEIGIDAAGLGRQFFNYLFQGLTQYNAPNILFNRRDNGQYLPTLRQKMKISPAEVEAYLSLGKVIAFLFNFNKRYPTGEIFDLQFFQKLTDLSPDLISMSSENYQKHLSELDIGPVLYLCTSLIDDACDTTKHYTEMTDSQKTFFNIQLFLTAADFGTLPAECIEMINRTYLYDLNPTNFPEIQKEVFNEFKGIYLSNLVAIHAIARGINEWLILTNSVQGVGYHDNKWEKFIEIEPRTLYETLQGTLTKNLFKESIEIFPHTNSKGRMLKIWLFTWINAASMSQIKQLLTKITGSQTITANIKISVSNEYQSIFYTTCYNTLRVPMGIERQTFFAELDYMSSSDSPERFNGI